MSIESHHQLLRSNREILARIAEHFDERSHEALVFESVIAIAGQETQEVPQCGMIFKVGIPQLQGSAVYLRNGWLVTALHVLDSGGPFQFVSPEDGAQFDLDPVVHESHGLALMKITSNLGHLPPDMVVATSVASDVKVELCGFGSNACECGKAGDGSAVGVRRLSAPQKILAISNSQIIVQNSPSYPLICLTDSGGACLTRTGSTRELVGIIFGVDCEDAVSKDVVGLNLTSVLPWVDSIIGV